MLKQSVIIKADGCHKVIGDGQTIIAAEMHNSYFLIRLIKQHTHIWRDDMCVDTCITRDLEIYAHWILMIRDCSGTSSKPLVAT